MKKIMVVTLLTSIVMCSSANAQNAQKPLAVADAKCKQLTPKVSDKITFDSKVFTLQWKANAFCGFHKYEYFSEDMKGNFFAYKEMILIDINQNISGKPAATVKTFIGGIGRNIQAKKKTDPIANYVIYENKKLNEAGVDFLQSGKVKEDDISEWNFYRVKEEGGSLITFGLSRRVYEKDANNMEQFKSMLGEKNAKVGKFAELAMPVPY